MFNKLKAVIAGAAMLVLGACATTPADPLNAATTLSQKAYAVYGTFVVYEEQGAALVGNPKVAPEAKAAIKAADAKAKPIVDAMMETAVAVDQIKKDVAAGLKDNTALYVVASNLQAWLNNAVPAVEHLVDAVKGAK